MVLEASSRFDSSFQVLVKWGVGMNFRPRPRRERRFLGGAMVVVKSWKARWVGLWK